MHLSRSMLLAGSAMMIAVTAGVVQPSSARLCVASTQAGAAGDRCGSAQVTAGRHPGAAKLIAGNAAGSWTAPVSGLAGSGGNALYPVSNGSNVAGLDILSVQLTLNPTRGTLIVTERVVDLMHPELTAAETGGRGFQQYVTRWRLGGTTYFAAMENTTTGPPRFFAGKAENAAVCSTSACDPGASTYPEPSLQRDPAKSDVHVEHGLYMCPGAPSPSQPCALAITVKLADIGNPGATSLLQDTGSYSFASAQPAGYIAADILARETSLPLQVDALCCFTYRASATSG